MKKTKIWLVLLILLFLAPSLICLTESFAAQDLPKLPDKVYFAGQKVDLSNPKIRERVEQEFYDFLNDKERISIVKKTGRYFPVFEEELKKVGLPDDLKYVAIVESNLKIYAYSSLGAAGLWQFMHPTGHLFGLKINKVIDERYDPYLSTAAAAQYFKKLLKMFNNDVFLAMAGYNAGEDKILNFLKKQEVGDYWSLYSSNETLRFVPRAIAAKIIFSDIEKYFGLSADDLYKPLEFEERPVIIKEKSKSLIKIAKENNVTLLEIETLNPQIRLDYLNKGTYKLRFPK